MQRTFEIECKRMNFTPENYYRHMKVSDKIIYTARDKPKGNIGEIFIINGELWMLTDCSEYSLEDYCKRYYLYEGFNSAEELWAELRRCYPDLQNTIRRHVFIKGAKCQ